jgi:hypothetical protein
MGKAYWASWCAGLASGEVVYNIRQKVTALQHCTLARQRGGLDGWMGGGMEVGLV